jgi:hypothetical protein
MAKLPEDFTPESIHGKTFRYTDAVEVMADMRRVRRQLGWSFTWVGSDEDRKRFRFEAFTVNLDDIDVPEQERNCAFEVLAQAIYQNLWPSLHTDNPEVPQLRRLFVDTKGGGHGIASLVNETVPKAPPVVEATSQSALDMLLDDDE